MDVLKISNKLFDKNNFKNGMVIELDTGARRLFWDGRFIDEYGFIPLWHYNDDLKNMDNILGQENIDKIYTVTNVGYFKDFFHDFNLTLIWSRYDK
jgi:hypothetical protein